jgi:hypothetical protein
VLEKEWEIRFGDAPAPDLITAALNAACVLEYATLKHPLGPMKNFRWHDADVDALSARERQELQAKAK